MPTPFEGIEELAAIHWKRRTWQDKPDWYWFLGLLEEVIELGLSLLRLHCHTPESEMAQIASICGNWMWKRVNE